jgi:hypothetical protein
MPADMDFSRASQAKEWLLHRPLEVAVVLAARAALRVAPRLVSALGPRGGGATRIGRDIVLPSFRGVATAWVAGQYPLAPDVRAAAVYAAERAATGAAGAYAAARSATDAAAAAARAATRATVDHAVKDAIAAFDLAPAAAAADAEIIDNGASASELALRPLWQTETPSWATWQRLEETLLKENQDWHVWTEWYRSRLEERPANEALEVARVTIPDEIWGQGPRAVNAERKCRAK